MRFLNELHECDRISGIYLCKQKQPAVTKNGKPYENIILQDKTGVMDGKIDGFVKAYLMEFAGAENA